MEKIKSHHNETTRGLFLVPQTFLDSLVEGQNKIIELLNSSSSPAANIGGYVSEPEAQKILGKKATWFWSMRTKGLLSFTKVGNKVFYSKQDIIALLNRNRQEAYS